MSQTTSTSSGPADSNTLHCDNFSAQILDGNGNPMRFYGIQREGHVVEAYLEAKEDEKFSVKVNSFDLCGTYSIRLELGGQWCQAPICSFLHWPITIQGRQISESEAETLKFRRTAITDDEMHNIRDPAEVDRVELQGDGATPETEPIVVTISQVYEATGICIPSTYVSHPLSISFSSAASNLRTELLELISSPHSKPNLPSLAIKFLAPDANFVRAHSIGATDDLYPSIFSIILGHAAILSPVVAPSRRAYVN
ncbi:hypothetical protein CF327_g7423 [Tilletia walkeri]|nr:hypothetical protein CF327_g7423 [Tilletia walkeri]